MGLTFNVLADRDSGGSYFFRFTGGDGRRGSGKVLGEERTMELLRCVLGLGNDVENSVFFLRRMGDFLFFAEVISVAGRKCGEFGEVSSELAGRQGHDVELGGVGGVARLLRGRTLRAISANAEPAETVTRLCVGVGGELWFEKLWVRGNFWVERL